MVRSPRASPRNAPFPLSPAHGVGTERPCSSMQRFEYSTLTRTSPEPPPPPKRFTRTTKPTLRTAPRSRAAFVFEPDQCQRARHRSGVVRLGLRRLNRTSSAKNAATISATISFNRSQATAPPSPRRCQTVRELARRGEPTPVARQGIRPPGYPCFLVGRRTAVLSDGQTPTSDGRIDLRRGSLAE